MQKELKRFEVADKYIKKNEVYVYADDDLLVHNLEEVEGLVVSTGVPDAGKIIALNAYGKIDVSLLAGSPSFATVKLTDLTDGYLPYHVSDIVGLADSPIFTNGTNVGIGTTSPLRRLDVNEASGNCLRLIYNDPDGSPANYVDFLVSSGGDLIITPSGADILLSADTTKLNFGAGNDMTVWYDGTYGQIKTSDVAASDLRVTCGADKTIELQNVVWDDVNVSLVTAKVPAANFPTWAAFTTNLYSYTFALNDYADLSTAEILHCYKEGTDLGIHLHLVTNGLNDATERKAKYTVYYSWGDMDEVMSGEGSLTQEVTIAANLADRTHLFLDMLDITGATYKIGSMLKLRVKRIAGTGTEPAADPFVEQVGIHYQINTIGSRQELIK